MSQPHPDRSADLFSESAGQTAEEYLAKSRLQVAFAITTGVLVIVITTAVVVVMSIKQTSIADSPNRPVGITSDVEIPIIPSLTPTPTPTASPEATPTATAAPGTTPTQTKKPATTPPPTTNAPVIAVLASLTCLPGTLNDGEVAVCTVQLTSPAHAALTVYIASSNDSSLSVPPSVTFSTGDTSQPFNATGHSSLLPIEVTVTVTMSGSSPKQEDNVLVNASL